DRRYICLPNYVTGKGRERLLIDQIALDHPLLEARVPLLDSVARAFDWEEAKKTMAEKYGAALPQLCRRHEEVFGAAHGLAKAGGGTVGDKKQRSRGRGEVQWRKACGPSPVRPKMPI